MEEEDKNKWRKIEKGGKTKELGDVEMAQEIEDILAYEEDKYDMDLDELDLHSIAKAW